MDETMKVEPVSEDVNSLRARLDELEAEVRILRGKRSRRRDRVDEPEVVSRRRMLGMLKGAAAAGAGLAVIGTSNQAYAADTDAVLVGGDHTGTTNPTRFTAPFTASPVLKSTNTAASGGAPGGIQGIQFSASGFITGGYGVMGSANANPAAGVYGLHIGSGVGVRGTSFLGADVQVQDYVDAVGGSPKAMPPTLGTWATGSLVNSAGQLWYCYVAGVGSASKWVRLSAGFVSVTPARVYDSRAAAPSPGILAASASRTISVADARNSVGGVTIPNVVPVGATAVAANITVTGTTGGFGFLSVNPGGNTSQATSAINWFGAGQNIANGLILTLNASRQVTVVCGTGGGSTQFIVDVSGYYL